VVRIPAPDERSAGAKSVRVGEWADVEITAADTYDLTGRLLQK
jgi:hypothetical protein